MIRQITSETLGLLGESLSLLCFRCPTYTHRLWSMGREWA